MQPSRASEAAGEPVPPRELDLLAQIDLAQCGIDEAASALQRAVADARAARLSWTKIGARLGVSKQAAQRRFRHVGPPQ